MGNARPPPFAAPNLPGPEQTEALVVPGNHRRCFDDEDTGPPFPPDGRQPDPQQSISSSQLRALYRSLQNAELVAEGEDLNL